MLVKDLLPFLFIPAVVLSASVRHEHPRSPRSSSSLEKRNNGGQLAKSNEFTYAVLMFLNTLPFCAGTLMDKETVVTSVACTNDDISQLHIHIGTHEHEGDTGHYSNVSSVVIHPHYEKDTFDNDVAIIKLFSPVPDKFKIVYPMLPKGEFDPAPDTVATLLGWGSNLRKNEAGKYLQKIDLPVISQTDCKKWYPDHTFTKDQFCAGSPDKNTNMCIPDIGGAAVDKSGNLIGLKSQGNSCGEKETPVILTSYSHHSISNFIKKYVNQP